MTPNRRRAADMIDKLASGLFVFCASFGALLSWWAFSAPVSFPASAIVLSLAVLWFGRSGPRSLAKTAVLSVAVLAIMVFNTALSESYYLTGVGFSETFFYHVRPDLFFAGLGEHSALIALALVLLAEAVMAFVIAVSQSKRSRYAKRSFLTVAIALCLWSPLQGIAGYWGMPRLMPGLTASRRGPMPCSVILPRPRHRCRATCGKPRPCACRTRATWFFSTARAWSRVTLTTLPFPA
jgi:hypothetical protein